jgi:hypothetical protein
MDRMLGIVIALFLPFLAVLAVGTVFDRKDGGGAMEMTSFALVLLSPLWLLLGGVAAVFAFNYKKIRRRLLIADAVLILFIVVFISLYRALKT